MFRFISRIFGRLSTGRRADLAQSAAVPVGPLLPLRVLTGAALLTALSVVLTRFASVMALGGQSIRIGLGAIPLVVAGLLLGPLAGAMAGLVADLIGVMINLMGSSFHPGFTLTSVLTGLLPALVLLAFKGELSTRSVVAAWLAVTLVCSLALQTLWVSQLYGNPYWAVLLSRLTLLPLVQGGHLVVLLGLLPVMKRLPLRKKSTVRSTLGPKAESLPMGGVRSRE